MDKKIRSRCRKHNGKRFTSLPQHSVWFVPTGMSGLPQNIYVPLNFRLEFPKSDLTIYLPSGISEISYQMVSTPGLPVAYQSCCLHDDVILNGVFPSEARRRPRFAIFIILSRVDRAQRGRNSSCDYFYRFLGCS